jgi:hypothetical protein
MPPKHLIVNHRKLFMKLTQRGVPGYIVRVLIYWYAHQKMQIKWGGSISAPFGVGHGVRQGGIFFYSNFIQLVCQ